MFTMRIHKKIKSKGFEHRLGGKIVRDGLREENVQSLPNMAKVNGPPS